MSLQRLTSLLIVCAFLGACSVPGGISLPGRSSSGAADPVASDNANAPVADKSAVAASPDKALVSDIPLAVRDEYARGVLLLETGDQTGAEAEFKRFSAANPRYPHAFVNLAIIYIARGELPLAEQMLDQALLLDEGFAPALNQQGIMHRKNGKFAEAEAAYLKAITVNPSYALAHLNLGILNDLYLGRQSEALSAYESYQALTVEEDPLVARWIADLTRRTAR